MKKNIIVERLKKRGLPNGYIMKRPKRVLLFYMRRFELFDKGNNMAKGNRTV